MNVTTYVRLTFLQSGKQDDKLKYQNQRTKSQEGNIMELRTIFKRRDIFFYKEASFCNDKRTLIKVSITM